MTISTETVAAIMRAVRAKSKIAEEEVTELAEACIVELEKAGVYIYDTDEALARHILKLYCKAHYGYDTDTARFREAYESLRDAMALTGDYAKKPEEGEA